jgi:hypothetical protein
LPLLLIAISNGERATLQRADIGDLPLAAGVPLPDHCAVIARRILGGAHNLAAVVDRKGSALRAALQRPDIEHHTGVPVERVNRA